MSFALAFVATTTRADKGKVYQTHLLRRTYRDGGPVRHQTLGNLSHWPPDRYAALDWLRRPQRRIDKKLAKKHLQDGTLVTRCYREK